MDRTIRVIIPTDTAEIRARKFISEHGTPQERGKANRALGVVVGGGGLYSVSAMLKKFIPPTNPQPQNIRGALLPLGIAAATYATGGGIGHAFINADEPKEVAKGLGTAAAASGLGVALYQANKAFIESGRYGKTTWPNLSMAGAAALAATPMAAYQLYKLRRKVEGAESADLVDFIRQKVREM